MQIVKPFRKILSIAPAAMAVIAMFAASACVTQGGDASVLSAKVTYIEPAQAQDLRENAGVPLIDVGDQSDFDRHHIEGAVRRPLTELKTSVFAGMQKIVVYDSGFGAVYSDAAQPVLNSLGDKLLVVKGGLVAWERSGLPVSGLNDHISDLKCKPISAAELRRALDQLDDFVVVDLRRKEDYEAVRIRGAVWAMPPDLEKLYKQDGKNKWVIFYNQSGFGAELSGVDFMRQGVRHCGHLIGGYDAWAGRTSSADASRKR